MTYKYIHIILKSPFKLSFNGNHMVITFNNMYNTNISVWKKNGENNQNPTANQCHVCQEPLD